MRLIDYVEWKIELYLKRLKTILKKMSQDD